MPRKCYIKLCSNSKAVRKSQGLLKDVTFHRFPSNENRRENWILNIQVLANQFGPIREGVVICSDHFDKESFEITSNGRRVLSSSAIPKFFSDVDQSFSDVEILHNNCHSVVENYGTNIDSLDINKDELSANYASNGVSDPNCDSQVKVEVEETPVSVIPSISQPIRMDYTLTPKPVTRNVQPVKSNSAVDDEIRKLNHELIMRRIQRIRYPGDINDMTIMSRGQLEHCAQLCKKKVDTQTVSIAALRRKLREKNRQVSTLRALVKDLKKRKLSK